MKRANRTHTEEFDAVTKAEPELEAFQAELLAWERVYNATGPTGRGLPHSRRLPAGYLVSLGVDV